MERVKGMSPPVGVQACRGQETAALSPSWRLRRPWRSLAAALCVLGCAPAGATETPLCDWFSGLSESAQALADGQPDRSEAAARRALAARPRASAGARASAALGLALRARGEHGAAADALEIALASSIVPARAHLAYLRGEALLLDGDAAAAARLLAEAARAERLAVGRRAAFLEGRALLQAGLPQEAVALLEGLLQRYPGDPAAPAARLDLSAAWRAAGDDAAAVGLYRAVWLSAAPPEADLAGDLLEVWRNTGGPVPAITPEDHLARAEHFLVDARPEDALRETQLAGEDDLAPAHRTEVLRALALAALGRMPEAARLAEPMSGSPDPSVRRTADLVLARAAARAGRLDEAIDRYRRVSASGAPVPGLSPSRLRDLGDEAAFMAAWLPYDAGDYARAAASLQAFGRTNPRSRRAEDALWFAAWSQVRRGDRVLALRALSRLATRGPLADAATYWQASLLGGSRQVNLLRRASALGGDGWYGFLARARLVSLGRPAPRPQRPVSRPLPEVLAPPSAAPLGVAVELFGLGLDLEGLDELQEVASSPGARAAAPHLAQLAAFAGDPELPFRMARDHLGPSRRALRWSHPAPHPEILDPTAAAAGVDPALVLAVMRRESSFRRAIRSGAGAEGLLQLRPATAERMATLLGLPAGAGSRLGDPTVNLPLGIHYLGLLAARFQDPAVALAGYNAGPAAAADWARARHGMPVDEWVECIPFRETRQYLKAVLPDWDIYRELRGEETAPIVPARRVPVPAKGVKF